MKIIRFNSDHSDKGICLRGLGTYTAFAIFTPAANLHELV